VSREREQPVRKAGVRSQGGIEMSVDREEKTGGNSMVDERLCDIEGRL